MNRGIPLSHSGVSKGIPLSYSGDMVKQVSYMIWGQAVSTTKAFKEVEVRVATETNMIFIKITLKWWARFKKAGSIREWWLRQAEMRARVFLPYGWRLVAYYDGDMSERN